MTNDRCGKIRAARSLPDPAAVYDSNGLDSAPALSGQCIRASRPGGPGASLRASLGGPPGYPLPQPAGQQYAPAVLPGGRRPPPAEEVTVRGRLRTVAALSALAMLAAACGSSGTSSSPPAGSPAGGSSSPAAAGGKFVACMVTDTGGINDKSFNQSSYAGVTAAAAADPNITPQDLPSRPTSAYPSDLTPFLGRKCGINVTVG